MGLGGIPGTDGSTVGHARRVIHVFPKGERTRKKRMGIPTAREGRGGSDGSRPLRVMANLGARIGEGWLEAGVRKTRAWEDVGSDGTGVWGSPGRHGDARGTPPIPISILCVSRPFVPPDASVPFDRSFWIGSIGSDSSVELPSRPVGEGKQTQGDLTRDGVDAPYLCVAIQRR